MDFSTFTGYPEYRYYDRHGNLDYEVDYDYQLIGGDQYIVEVRDEESEIPANWAILMVFVFMMILPTIQAL